MGIIHGPFPYTVSNCIPRAGSFYIFKNRYRQEPPYDRATDQYRSTFIVTRSAKYCGREVDNDPFANACMAHGPWYGYAYAITSAEFESVIALDKARNQFLGRLGENSELFLELLQRKQTLSMLESYMLGTYRFIGERRWFNRWRRGRISDLAGFWLQFYFGLVPFVKSIQETITVLDQPWPFAHIVGKGRYKWTWEFAGPPPPGKSGWWGSHDISAKARIQADVSVVDPDVYMATALGLTNPLPAVVDAIPWTFVLGWFTNLNSYLRGWSDLKGLSVSNAFHSVLGECSSHTNFADYDTTVYPWVWQRSRGSYESRRVEFQRFPGLPPVTFRLRPFELSAARAATISALIVQKLKRLKALSAF